MDRKPLTRYRVTDTGRKALRRYVDSVEQLLRATPSDAPRSAAG
ncbi:hypothetical protein [Candidatus Palauibacter sp.]